MKQKTRFDKINQIISFSNNYTKHKKNLKQVKSQIDTYDKKRETDFSRLRSEKSAYYERNIKDKKRALDEENKKIVERLTNISESRVTQKRSSSTFNFEKTQSLRTLSSKTRSNFLKKKQIAKQNEKMAQRILNSHSKERLGPQRFRESTKKYFQYKKVHCKYSDRSQTQLNQIIKDMKMKPTQIPFLPQIQSTRYTEVSRKFKSKH